jgi:hypothetical protein
MKRMDDFKVEKTFVDAPVRMLKATWTAGQPVSMRVLPLTRWQKVKRWVYDRLPNWAWPKEVEEKTAYAYLLYPDNCQVCLGASGGVRGNENIVDDVVTCDYCDSAGRTLNMVPTHG